LNAQKLVRNIDILAEEPEIPYYFTPNGDGNQDEFMIPLEYKNLSLYPDYELTIFSRWGVLVYHRDKSQMEDWNGRLHGDGPPLPDGNYFYLLNLNISGKPKKKIGTVSIIR